MIIDGREMFVSWRMSLNGPWFCVQATSFRIPIFLRNLRSNVYNTLHIDGITADAQLDETLDYRKKNDLRALKLTKNVQSQAAELLGIGKSGLNWKIKKLKLDVGSKV